jgi:ATP adenylyltransferase/5',5'''-P-1,P-4-tetraphosphate phosphorylase II
VEYKKKKTMSYQNKANDLYYDQLNNWSLFTNNQEGLKSTRIKTFKFDGFSINVQYNPKRIVSSAAKVDVKSIKERSCFLCKKNRPREQKEIIWRDNYEILVNPFPIFKQHFTISNVAHIEQQIETEFINFISLSKDLPDLVIFYNAPKCGASAPDHLHFQAGNLDFLPIEKEWESIKLRYGKRINNNENVEITAVDDAIRRFFVLESDDAEALNNVFDKIHTFDKNLNNGEAPMLNILSYYTETKHRVFVFMRKLHRPWQYFSEGDKNILLSPASVDMGGTMITPLEKDFEKITQKDIIDIFQQITISKNDFNDLIKKMNI